MNSEQPLPIRKFFLLFILLMAVPRWYAMEQPLEMDISLYSVIAHELLEGRLLYSDLWEHKPPAVFLTVSLAQLVGGYGPGSIFILGWATSILTCFAVYYAAGAGDKGKTTGLWAAAFWAVISADVFLQADLPNVEAFMNPCLAGVFALMLRAQGHVKERSRWLWIGILLAWASLYKPIVLFFALGLAIAHFAFPPGDGSRREALGQIFWVFGVGLFAWGLTFLYFFGVGHFTEFWETVFVYNQYYAGNILQSLGWGLRPQLFFPMEAFGILPLIGLCLAGLVICRWRPWSRTSTLFLAYGITTFIMVCSPGKFYEHYYQLWFPVLAIGGAWTLAEIKKKGRLPFPVRRWAGVFIIALLVILQAGYYRYPPEGWSRLKYKDRFLFTEIAAIRIMDLLKPEERFHLWGFDPGLYYITRRSPVSGFLNYKPLFEGPLVEKYSARFKDQFLKNRPELLVLTPIGGKDLPLFQWMIKDYETFPDQAQFKPYEFYYLRGGQLEKRVTNSSPVHDSSS